MWLALDGYGAIGVMDSGVGGISVLNAARRLLPFENYIYLSDSRNAPYGKRSESEILKVVLDNTERLLLYGCKAIVIACNTATAVAVSNIRQLYPDIPIVGLEPAVRPALSYAREAGGDVLVLSTELTARSERLRTLCLRCCEALGGYFVDCGASGSDGEGIPRLYSVPIQETVRFVEHGKVDSFEHIEYLKKCLLPYRDRSFSAVVLGCTHFPFAEKSISKALGYSVSFFDGAEGAARRLGRLLNENKKAHSPYSVEKGWVQWLDTGGENGAISKLRFFSRMGCNTKLT